MKKAQLAGLIIAVLLAFANLAQASVGADPSCDKFCGAACPYTAGTRPDCSGEGAGVCFYVGCQISFAQEMCGFEDGFNDDCEDPITCFFECN